MQSAEPGCGVEAENIGGDGSMSDNRTPESRSALMSRIGGRDTAPELTVRRMLHALGYRFRLHRRDLPGTPDVVFPSRRKAIFVNGCFWHAHGCKIGKPPKSKRRYWTPKLERNRARDRENRHDLHALGWRSMTVWQCQIRNPGGLPRRLISFLGPPGNFPIDIPAGKWQANVQTVLEHSGATSHRNRSVRRRRGP
jgi:DNA mismatch endonuclease (patch repair protein)